MKGHTNFKVQALKVECLKIDSPVFKYLRLCEGQCMLLCVLPSGLVPDSGLPGLPAGPPLILLRYQHVRHALQAGGLCQ